MNKNSSNQNVVASDFVDILRDVVRQEIISLDTTILCKIVEINNDGSYNVYIEPDESTIVTNIPSILETNLAVGDYVYIYKIRNQLNNSFIIKKVGQAAQSDVKERLDNIDQEIVNLNQLVQNTTGSGGGEWGSQTANYVFAAPNGHNGIPSFRALVVNDIPGLTASKIISGTFDSARIPDLSSKYISNYSLSITTSAGNPRLVKFVRVNYTTFDGNNAAYFKIGAMCSHGNGSSYTFLEDIIIGCNMNGDVTCQVYKQIQNASTYTIDSTTAYFGDVFYVVDTTNKYVDFYIVAGQYATINFTPFMAIGATVKDTSKISQYTGSATLYSSGTKVWADGNGTIYARKSDIPTKTSELTNDSGYITSSYHDSTKEDVSNKVSSLSSSSTDTQYPSAKCVYDAIPSTSDCLKNNVNGTITGNSSDTPLTLQSKAAASYIGFKDTNGTALGYFGVNSSKKPVFYDTQDHQLAYLSDIPSAITSVNGLSGGTISSTTTINGDLIANYVKIGSISHETTSTYDKHLTLSSTNYVRYRTTSELRGDLKVPNVIGLKIDDRTNSAYYLNRTYGSSSDITISSTTAVYDESAKKGDIVVDYWGSIGVITSVSGSTATVKTMHVSPTSFFCLVEGTMITLADGTQKPIEQINAGDVLKGYDYTKPTYITTDGITKKANQIVGTDTIETFNLSNDCLNTNVVITCGLRGEDREFDCFTLEDGTTLMMADELHNFFSYRELMPKPHNEFVEGDTLLGYDLKPKKVVKISKVQAEQGYKKYYTLVTSNNSYFANGVLCFDYPYVKYESYKNVLHEEIPAELKDLFEQDMIWYKWRSMETDNNVIKKTATNQSNLVDYTKKANKNHKALEQYDYKDLKIIEQLIDTLVESNEENLVNNLLGFANDIKQRYGAILEQRKQQRQEINVAEAKIEEETSNIKDKIDTIYVDNTGYSSDWYSALLKYLYDMAIKDNAAFDRYNDYYNSN